MRLRQSIGLLLFVTCLSGCICKRGAQGGVGEGAEGSDNIPPASAGTELADIHFDYDSAHISSTAGQLLQKNARWIQAHPNTEIVVEGHCDERGTNEYNLALGERRAAAVVDHLRSLGVQSGKFAIVSYGEEIPLDPGHTESAWAKNRRAHFAIK